MIDETAHSIPSAHVRRLAQAPPDDPDLMHYQDVLWTHSLRLHAQTFAPEIKAVMRQGGIVAGMGVLDAACGSGAKSRLLLDIGAAQVVGVDVDADELAQTPSDDRLHFMQHGLFEPLPFAAATFDAVYVGDLALPLYDDAVFAELQRVLRPGGVLLVESVHPLPALLYNHALQSRVDSAFHAALADTAYGEGESYAAAFHRMRGQAAAFVVPAVRCHPFDPAFVHWVTLRFVCQYAPLLRSYLAPADFALLLDLHDPMHDAYLFAQQSAFAVTHFTAYTMG